ncbi:hypothetical protein Bhyg_13056, partial [Pseudolycoriella hygida]
TAKGYLRNHKKAKCHGRQGTHVAVAKLTNKDTVSLREIDVYG